MATGRTLAEPMTIEAFDTFIETKGDDARLYELVDGVIVMMSNPTEAHEQIAANISSPLKVATDKQNCRTYIGGMRVQLSEKVSGIDKTKPDVLVRRTPAGFELQVLKKPEDRLEFESLGFEIDLANIYFGVET